MNSHVPMRRNVLCDGCVAGDLLGLVPNICAVPRTAVAVHAHRLHVVQSPTVAQHLLEAERILNGAPRLDVIDSEAIAVVPFGP